MAFTNRAATMYHKLVTASPEVRPDPPNASSGPIAQPRPVMITMTSQAPMKKAPHPESVAPGLAPSVGGSPLVGGAGLVGVVGLVELVGLVGLSGGPWLPGGDGTGVVATLAG